MALGTGQGLKGMRDRALLLLGFAGAFRRSELVALKCEDLEESETGFKIIIRRSKTDQEGEGATIAVVRGSVACPVEALKAWLVAASNHHRPALTPGVRSPTARGFMMVSDQIANWRPISTTISLGRRK
jgi:integrase